MQATGQTCATGKGTVAMSNQEDTEREPEPGAGSTYHRRAKGHSTAHELLLDRLMNEMELLSELTAASTPAHGSPTPAAPHQGRVAKTMVSPERDYPQPPREDSAHGAHRILPDAGPLSPGATPDIKASKASATAMPEKLPAGTYKAGVVEAGAPGAPAIPAVNLEGAVHGAVAPPDPPGGRPPSNYPSRMVPGSPSGLQPVGAGAAAPGAQVAPSPPRPAPADPSRAAVAVSDEFIAALRNRDQHPAMATQPRQTALAAAAVAAQEPDIMATPDALPAPERADTGTKGQPPDAMDTDRRRLHLSIRSVAVYVANLLLGVVLVLATAAAGLAAYGIATGHTADMVITGSMVPTIPIGALVITKRVPVSSLKTGDIIGFPRPGEPQLTYFHRIISETQSGGMLLIHTKGDANFAADPWVLKRPLDAYANQVAFIIPGAGVVAQVILRLAILAILILIVGWAYVNVVRRLWSESPPDPSHS